MAKRNFTIPHFVRNINIELLQAYFKQANISYPDFLNVTEKDNNKPNEEAITKFINSLDTQYQEKITNDFIEVNELAYEGGILSIIDVANIFSVNIKDNIAEQEDYTNQALYCFIEYNNIFVKASQFAYYEGLTSKSIIHGLVKRPVEQITTEETRKKLESELKIYFKQTDGRGANCKIDVVTYKDRVFYHALPQNYTQIQSVYDNKGDLKRATVNPTFEIVYIYYLEEGKLEFSGNFREKRRKHLVNIFNKVVLQDDREIEDKSQAFDFDKIISSEFSTPTKLEDKILWAYLKQIRLSYKYIPSKKVTLEFDDKGNKGAIHEMIKELNLNIEQLNVTQATFKIKFEGIGNKGSVTAIISYPDKCNLSDTPTHEKAKEYLRYWGLELNHEKGNN